MKVIIVSFIVGVIVSSIAWVWWMLRAMDPRK